MTTAGGFLVPLIPGGWAHHNWIFSCLCWTCPKMPLPCGAWYPALDTQRWAGASQGWFKTLSGSFLWRTGGFWKPEESVVVNKLTVTAAAAGNTAGILDIGGTTSSCWLASCSAVLSKAEDDPFEFGDSIKWKRAKTFDVGSHPLAVLWINNYISTDFNWSRIRYQSL